MATDPAPWRALLGLESPWSALFVGDAAQTALLLLRTGLLVAAALLLVEAPTRRRLLSFALVGALVVGSIEWRALLLPALLVGLALVLTSAPARAKVAVAVLATVLLPTAGVAAFASVRDAQAAFEQADASPPAATTRALERGNAFEARFWAERWSRMEGSDPREGTLIWARVEEQAGHRSRARAILQDLVQRARGAAIRAQGQTLLADLDRRP